MFEFRLDRITLALLGITMAVPATAQQVSCGSDVPCLAGRAVFGAVVAAHGQDGLIQFAVGTLCEDTTLKNLGKSRYDATLQQVIQTAHDSLLQDHIDAAAAEPYLRSLPALVKTARSTEASGVLAGLRSSFAMYPGSKSEYCSRMKAALTH